MEKFVSAIKFIFSSLVFTSWAQLAFYLLAGNPVTLSSFAGSFLIVTLLVILMGAGTIVGITKIAEKE
jgi:hypothetical protein